MIQIETDSAIDHFFTKTADTARNNNLKQSVEKTPAFTRQGLRNESQPSRGGYGALDEDKAASSLEKHLEYNSNNPFDTAGTAS